MASSLPFPKDLKIIDSHTEGEPTRVIVSGFPALRGDTLVEKRADFAARFDHLRTELICEPRGYDAMVGALLISNGVTPTGVIFFNDAGYLGMCGHGTIGVAETLRFMGLAPSGTVRLDTPAGLVEAFFEPDSRAITIQNVPSYFHASASIELGGEVIHGEIAYGGNWFWLQEVPLSLIDMNSIDSLITYTKAIRESLRNHGITGRDGADIDHIELFAYQEGGSKNFVLCPGKAYDRSPCGTGTSAKLASLAHHGKLLPGEIWRNESVSGGVFFARYELTGNQVIPFITGRAYVTGRFEPVF